MHGGDRKSTDAKSSSLNANLIDSSKTCDRIAEENGVSRASVLRASHYTRGIDIADNRSPGIKQKVLRFAMQRPALDLNEPEACMEQRGRPTVTCRGGGPSILLTQDRSVAQKPHWGFCCCANASLPWQAEQAHHTPSKKNRAFPTGNALLYISLSSVVFCRVRPIRGRTLFFYYDSSFSTRSIRYPTPTWVWIRCGAFGHRSNFLRRDAM